ncbi:MAG TPA: VWA domain-containing protein [Kofleriaceae bacterium]
MALAMVASSPAYADAVLTTGDTQVFPTRIDISVEIRAQIEATTIVLELPAIATPGDYTLTMPAPDGAMPIGVDIDRGAGFEPLPVVAGAPPSASGNGTSGGAYDAWVGTAPLGAALKALEPGPLTARVRFVRILRRVGGKVGFQVGSWRCPLRSVSDPGAPTTVHFALATARDLASFSATSPTLDTSSVALDATARGARFDAPAAVGDAVVDVSYAQVSTGINVQFVTHRTPTSDPMGGVAGYFLLLVDADEAPSTKPRAISMVIDHSGSMAGDKIAQARDAARAMLDYLRPDDSFTIHIFDDDIDSFRATPVAATPENIDAARSFIKSIDDDGSTNLNEGLQVSLAAPTESDRFDATVMLSDGLATSGETDDRKILANAWRAAGDTRIFTFSVGGDADFALMQALAQGSRGRHVDLNNAQATRDLVLRARELFEDIRDVRLTDMAMDISDLGVADALPEKMPDLFSGGQVIVVGRYTTPGTGALGIAGMEGALPFDQTYVVDAPELAEGNDIIKYVWASEKVRALMATIADGADESVVHAEVEAIGLAYRIQTPYTHYSADYGSGGSDGGGCSVAGTTGGIWLVVALVLVRRRRRAA